MHIVHLNVSHPEQQVFTQNRAQSISVAAICRNSTKTVWEKGIVALRLLYLHFISLNNNLQISHNLSTYIFSAMFKAAIRIPIFSGTLM